MIFPIFLILQVIPLLVQCAPACGDNYSPFVKEEEIKFWGGQSFIHSRKGYNNLYHDRGDDVEHFVDSPQRTDFKPYESSASSSPKIYDSDDPVLEGRYDDHSLKGEGLHEPFDFDSDKGDD